MRQRWRALNSSNASWCPGGVPAREQRVALLGWHRFHQAPQLVAQERARAGRRGEDQGAQQGRVLERPLLREHPAEAVAQQVDAPEIERRAHLLDLAHEPLHGPERRVVGRLGLAAAELVVEDDAEVVGRQVGDRVEVRARAAGPTVQAEERARAGAVDPVGDLTALDGHAPLLDGLHRGTVPMWGRDMRRGRRSRSATRISRSSRRAMRATPSSDRPTTRPSGTSSAGSARSIPTRSSRAVQRGASRSWSAPKPDPTGEPLIRSESCPYR